MKYLKILLPLLIFVLLLYAYLKFHPQNKNVNEIKKSNNIKKVIPSVDFQGTSIIPTNQKFLLNLPSQSDVFYSLYYPETPYSIAGNLGINIPPESTSSSQIVWIYNGGQLIYSNGSYFESYKSLKSGVQDIYTYSENIMKKDFEINSYNFKDTIFFTQGEEVLNLYPQVNNQYIYKENGEKFYDQFIFNLKNQLKSFSIYPFNLKMDYGYYSSFKLTNANISQFPFYANVLSIRDVYFSNQSNGFYIDLKNKNLVPIYIISGKADILNGSSEGFFLYVPEIKIN